MKSRSILLRCAPMLLVLMLFGFIGAPGPALAADIPVNCNPAPNNPNAVLEVGNFTADEVAANPARFRSVEDAVAALPSVFQKCDKGIVGIRLTEGDYPASLPPAVGVPDTKWTILIVGQRNLSPEVVDNDSGSVVTHNPIGFFDLIFATKSNGYFRPTRPLKFTQCAINSDDANSLFVLTEGEGKDGDNLISFERSFVDTKGQLLKSQGIGYGRIHVYKNAFDVYGRVPLISDRSKPKSLSDNQSRLSIVDNSFKSKGQGDYCSILDIGRGNVLIESNTFGSGDSLHDCTAIELSADKDKRNLLDNIIIKDNIFKMSRAVLNGQKDGPGPDAYGKIEITRNDLGKVDQFLPKTTTYLDGKRIDASCNYWRDLDKRSDVKADPESLKRYLTSLDKGLEKEDCVTGNGQTQPTPTPTPTPPPTNPPPTNPPPTNPPPTNPPPTNPPPTNPPPTNPPPTNPPPTNPPPTNPPPTNPPPTNPPPTSPPPVVPPPSGGDPSPGPAGDDDDRYGGRDRVGTAVDISQSMFPNGAKGVIVARSDDAADSVSAVPFAKFHQMPILLTQPDALHPETAKEIKRLMPDGGTVYIMGREAAIHPSVEADIKAIVGKTQRLAGENRAGTAVDTATQLEAMGKLKHIIVTDGSDWQPDLLAGPAAAFKEGATLLTWGERMAPETQAYLASHTKTPVTVIGAKAAKTKVSPDVIDETDPTKLGLAVIAKFFPEPRVVGFATNQDFADALTGGAHMAGLHGPLLLIGDKTPPEITKWVKDTKSLKRLVIYGGELRISPAQETDLRTALKH